MSHAGTSNPAKPGSGLFGIDTEASASAIHIISVPFDATASSGRGAASGPDAILKASHQVELFHDDADGFWDRGIVLCDAAPEISVWNREATEYVDAVRGELDDALHASYLREVNRITAMVDKSVAEQASAAWDDGRSVGLVGGDHATALGLMTESSRRHKGLGILWIDAHHDLRKSYEGFERSHASVLYNVIKQCPTLARVVQVGVRDFCSEERDRVADSGGLIVAHDDAAVAFDAAEGRSYDDRMDEIMEGLPHEVHISFDIDGLDPSLCPGTGTPVPGGLSYHQAIALVRRVVQSGRKLVSFDLVEVAPGAMAIDAIVGSRMLFELCAQLSLSADSPPR